VQQKFQECQEENTALKVRIGILEELNERLNDDISLLKVSVLSGI
jgi:sRNA-binding protein